MLRRLEILDNLLSKCAREARVRSDYSKAFPVSDDDYTLLIKAPSQYREAEYSIGEVGAYLLRLPELDEIWGHVCRGILRDLRSDPGRRGEWRLWLKQIEQAGPSAVKKTLIARELMAWTYENGHLTMINNVIQKLTVVDWVLDEIHGELCPGSERQAHFSTELAHLM
jgi:hypothetical protein